MRALVACILFTIACSPVGQRLQPTDPDAQLETREVRWATVWVGLPDAVEVHETGQELVALNKETDWHRSALDAALPVWDSPRVHRATDVRLLDPAASGIPLDPEAISHDGSIWQLRDNVRERLADLDLHGIVAVKVTDWRWEAKDMSLAADVAYLDQAGETFWHVADPFANTATLVRRQDYVTASSSSAVDLQATWQQLFKQTFACAVADLLGLADGVATFDSAQPATCLALDEEAS